MIFYSFSPSLILQIIWVAVPIGQYTHQDLGLNMSMLIIPNISDVSMRL